MSLVTRVKAWLTRTDPWQADKDVLSALRWAFPWPVDVYVVADRSGLPMKQALDALIRLEMREQVTARFVDGNCMYLLVRGGQG